MYQEVLINIWRSLDKFRGESKLSTFIYRIAVNVSITYASKSFKQSKLYVSADTENINEIIDEPHEDNEQQIQQLHTALNTLSVIDKALISLVLEGLTMKEIANIIGITEPNVKVKIHRIKTYLKKELTR
jgi:RNA polymerase sigma-70 factor (ECF subfamily)